MRERRDDTAFAVGFSLSEGLLNGVDDIGLTMRHEAEIAAYEARRAAEPDGA